jgi:hypothetical protein
LDYDHLREPDYDVAAYRQSSEITNYIKTFGQKVLENWHQRDALTEIARGKTLPDKRSRSIYYDTDNIQEHQDETIRICDDCGGALRIESSADRKKPILCIHIPINACTACQKQGHRWFDTAKSNQFSEIFLQDRTTDLYLSKNQK